MAGVFALASLAGPGALDSSGPGSMVTAAPFAGPQNMICLCS
jgi:hypothetical protein